MLEYVPLIILIVGGGGGLAAAIYQFLQTPRAERYQFPVSQSAAQKLASELESGAAIAIEPQPRKALLRSLPLILLCLPIVIVFFSVAMADDPACSSLLGINLAYWNLLLIGYGLPVLLFALLFSSIPTGIKVLRCGYFPPLDSISFTRLYARKGWHSTSIGVVMLLTPLIALYASYTGHQLYQSLIKNSSYSVVQQKLTQQCADKKVSIQREN